jgi:hypothetical protein
VQQLFQSGWRRVDDDVRDVSTETEKASLYYWSDNGIVHVLTFTGEPEQHDVGENQSSWIILLCANLRFSA